MEINVNQIQNKIQDQTIVQTSNVLSPVIETSIIHVDKQHIQSSLRPKTLEVKHNDPQVTISEPRIVEGSTLDFLQYIHDHQS